MMRLIGLLAQELHPVYKKTVNYDLVSKLCNASNESNWLREQYLLKCLSYHRIYLPEALLLTGSSSETSTAQDYMGHQWR